MYSKIHIKFYKKNIYILKKYNVILYKYIYLKNIM